MHRHALTDEQWAAVEPLLPERTAKTGRPPKDPRLMLDGIFWVLCTGAPWRRDLPPRFGPWQTVYDHFRNWRNGGTFATVLDALQLKLDQAGLIDWDLWCVDGASVRAARAAGGACKKVARKAAASGTPTSPGTTRWAAAEAGSGPSSTWLPTARELRWRSR
jgi:transposase